MSFTELVAITGGKLSGPGKADKGFTGVAIDSRTMKSGELFVAVRGESKDGHDFIDQAIAAGAAGVIAESSHKLPPDTTVVSVADSHQAMLKLARTYRDSIDARFAGITGSNGKTTTKELACRLIRAVEDQTYCSPGNLNNLYGVPLAIFAIPENTRVAVLEMGISTRDEMPRLAQLVHPDVILLTNVGPSHLEFLDSVEAVAQAKLELVKVAAPGVPVIINGDDQILVDETGKVRSDYITFGLDQDADFTADHVSTAESGDTLVTIEGHQFRLPLAGKHQVYNLLAAYALTRTLGYSLEGMDTLALELETAPMRGQRLVKSNIVFLADCYNANPDSVRAGLQTYFGMETTGRRIVILGDMLELGKESERYHREVGRLLSQYDFDLAIVVGKMAAFIMDEAIHAGVEEERFQHFDNAHKAAAQAADLLAAADFVYIKGSRGVGLEAVLDIFDQKQEQV